MTRQDAIDILVGVIKTQKALDMAIKALEQKQKPGKWIVDRYCSECEWDKQEASYTSGWVENFCPNCGAKMEGADDD